MLKKILFTVHSSLDCFARQSRKSAFTLAETLIVMGIIGVVAALTLPNLNSSTGEKEKVAKLQKIYQNINDAYGRAVAVYGPFDEWFVNDGNDNDKKAKRTFERITEFMKYSKVCTINDNCTLKFNSSGISAGETSKYGVILADGSTVGFDYPNVILIDIDGFNKGPNSAGKDFFRIFLSKDNLAIHDKGCHLDNTFVNICLINTHNGGVTYSSSHSAEWVLINGNMDYLKVGSDGKCPDGQKLQFNVKTSCK